MSPDLRAGLLPGARLVLDTANSLLAPVDALFAPRADGVDEGGRCVFVLGAPRSGTTLVYQIITQQFDVAYLTGVMNYLYGMPNLWARVSKHRVGRPPPIFESRYGKTPGVFAPAEPANFWFRWFPRDGIDGNYLAAEALSGDKLIQLRNALNCMIRIHQKPMAFKNVYLDMVIPILAKALPRACFVFLRRDMLWNCHSLVLARRRQGLENRWWSVRPPGYRKLLAEPLWKQAAQQVLRTREIIERDLRDSAEGRFLEVEYEALCDDPRSVLARLKDWLEPRGFVAFPDIRLPRRFPRRSEWTLEQDQHAVRDYLERSWRRMKS
ncbi:MAG TPA: sulfotransferase [Gammaproteobacteria bacterium]|nr:sulfotransferase [Gammaproteobacteria bacterium]